MKKFAIGALCSVASLAFAQEGTMETTTTGDSPIKVFANIDLNVAKIDSGIDGLGEMDMGYNLAVGADGVYMLTETMGVGLGLDYNMLAGEKDVSGENIELSASYLDIPISFAYSLNAMPNLNFTFLAGPYVGIAMGKWEFKDDSGTTKIDANMAYGINLETHATWTLTDTVALGGHLGFKYNFADLADEKDLIGENKDQNYWAVGIGIGAKFL